MTQMKLFSPFHKEFDQNTPRLWRSMHGNLQRIMQQVNTCLLVLSTQGTRIELVNTNIINALHYRNILLIKDAIVIDVMLLDSYNKNLRQ